MAFQERRMLAAALISVTLLGVEGAYWRKAEALGGASVLDVLALPELARVVPLPWLVAIGLFIALVLGLFFWNRRRFCHVEWKLVSVGILTGFISFGGVYYKINEPSQQVAVPQHHGYGIPGTLIRDWVSRAHSRQALASADLTLSPVSGVTGALQGPLRSLHVIVQESWTLDGRIEGVATGTHPTLAAWSRATGPGIVSPVVGSRSAEARFEMLCGLPAADPSAWIPHWRIHAPMSCLPSLFSAAGAMTRSSTPGPPNIFEVGRVLPLLGFSEVLFGDGISYPATPHRMHHAASAALEVDRPRIAGLAGAGPAFTWHFVLEGHWPWPEQPPERPARERWIAALGKATAAVVDRVKALRAASPDSIIVVASDHAPPEIAPVGATPSAMLAERTVPLAVLGPEGPIALPLLAHWELPYVLLDLVSDGTYCRAFPCPDLSEPMIRPLFNGVLIANRDGTEPRFLSFDEGDAATGLALVAVADRILDAASQRGAALASHLLH
jgi:hypothetical protein